MGTNYYLTTRACPTCGISKFDKLHIGKSSMGWTFALHIYPAYGITDFVSWLPLIVATGTFIHDEYDRLISVEELLDVITNRTRDEVTDATARMHGYNDVNHFYERNGAELGPNGLMRRRIDGGHVVGHGIGTYDYCIGDFS